jgi:hypothetical protein
MQATQSRKASGSWCREGQFAALRYVSRHLDISVGLDANDDVERERGIRRGLLLESRSLSPAGDDAAEDTQGLGEDRVRPDHPESSYTDTGYAAREMLRRVAEESACDSGAKRTATIEEGLAGEIGC